MHEFEKTEDYQLFCEERLQNPYPLFSRMRTEDPVHWSHADETLAHHALR